MKPNKITPGYNLLWESSRMMLPEHKQVLQRHQKELNKKTKPILDEQQVDLFSQVISEAMKQNIDVKVQIFHPYRNSYIVGKIQKIAPERDQIQLSSENNVKWIYFDEIIDVSFLTKGEIDE